MDFTSVGSLRKCMASSSLSSVLWWPYKGGQGQQWEREKKKGEEEKSISGSMQQTPWKHRQQKIHFTIDTRTRHNQNKIKYF